MHRRIAVLAGAALAAAAVAAPAGAQAPPAPQTLTLTESANGGSFNIVDNAPKSRGRGENTRFSSKDAIVITSPLLDASRKRAGRLRAVCFVSRPGTFRTVELDCVGVYALSTGKLYVAITFKLSESHGKRHRGRRHRRVRRAARHVDVDAAPRRQQHGRLHADALRGRQSSVMRTLPLAWPCSTYASASRVWSNGNVLSMTGRRWPAS